jgi:menaquinone-dependent protoporphyrinogen IX oxidase
MAMGWHLSALNFMIKNRKALSHVPLAVFVMCMSLTATSKTKVNGVPVFIDGELTTPPHKKGLPSLKELHSNVAMYAAPIIQAAGRSHLVSIGFFGGKVEYSRLKPLARVFVQVLLQVQPCDRRNWKTIRSWAHSLPAQLIPINQAGLV